MDPIPPVPVPGEGCRVLRDIEFEDRFEVLSKFVLVNFMKDAEKQLRHHAFNSLPLDRHKLIAVWMKNYLSDKASQPNTGYIKAVTMKILQSIVWHKGDRVKIEATENPEVNFCVKEGVLYLFLTLFPGENKVLKAKLMKLLYVDTQTQHDNIVEYFTFIWNYWCKYIENAQMYYQCLGQET